MQVDRREASLESRHADPVKFWELVAGRGPDYEEGCWPTLHKPSGAGAALQMSPRQVHKPSAQTRSLGLVHA